MAKPKPAAAAAKPAGENEETPVSPAAPKPARWKPSYKFVEYRGRKMTIKLVDEENGFKPGQVAMTVNGPAPISHATEIKIDKDGYVAKSANEEAALLKLAKKPIHGRAGSLLVIWEDREMPEDQRKAELSAAEYRKRNEELEAELADKSALEDENRQQKDLIARLEAQLAANQGG